MGCGKKTPPNQQTLATADSVIRYEPFTKWMPVIGIDNAILLLKVRSMFGTLHFQPAVQYADVRTDLPGSWGDLGTMQTGGAGEYNTGSVQLAGGSQFFVRFGVGYKSSTGGSRAEADVQHEAAFVQCGRVVGTFDETLVATDTGLRYVAITGWMPSVDIEKVKATFVRTSLLGSGFQVKLAWQKASTSVENPGSWAAVPSAPAYTTAGEANTTELNLAASYGTPREMWVRFGLEYTLTTGSFGSAAVGGAIAVRT